MTREEKAIRNEQMREYKAEGHSLPEVAERFGVSETTASNVCKGIAPQKRPVVNLRNQYTNGTFDRIENCKRIIERYRHRAYTERRNLAAFRRTFERCH